MMMMMMIYIRKVSEHLETKNQGLSLLVVTEVLNARVHCSGCKCSQTCGRGSGLSE